MDEYARHIFDTLPQSSKVYIDEYLNYIKAATKKHGVFDVISTNNRLRLYEYIYGLHLEDRAKRSLYINVLELLKEDMDE